MLGIHLLRSSGPPKTDTWVARYGDSGAEYGRGVVVDSLGFTYTLDLNSTVVKQDAFGRIVWQKQIGTSNDGRDIAIDSSDNIIVVGRNDDDRNDASFAEGFVAKLDSDGALQWIRSAYTASKSIDFRGVAVAADGSVYAVGQITTDQYPVIYKFNSFGTFQWGKYYSTSDRASFWGCTVDTSGNVIACGDSEVSFSANPHGFIVKLNSSGTEQWKTQVGSGIANGVFASQYVKTDSSGNIYVATWSVYDPAYTHTKIHKFDSTGALQWAKKMYHTAQSVASPPSGLVVEGSYLYLAFSWQGIGVAKIALSDGALSWVNAVYNNGSDAMSGSSDLYIDGDFINVSCSVALASNDSVLAKIPLDGSGSGTFGGYFTYGTLSGYTYDTSTQTTVSLTASLVNITTNRTPSIPASTTGMAATIYYYEG